MKRKPRPLALIAGPTASGKSALALALAERANGVVINADSIQVYRDLRIVTARPGAGEEARAPHRLFGYRDGADACSAAAWAADARAEIAAVHAADRLPILAGGTGLYLRTLLDGIAPVPEIDPKVRAHVREMIAAEAHRALAREDPEGAARLRATDSARVARALEVLRSTGKPLRAWQGERVGGIAGEVELRPLVLLPPRAWLHMRCDARAAAIVSEEGRAEVAALLARRLPPVAPVMRAIGVAEIAAWIEGEIRATALERVRSATRQYAKRQYTWFRRQPPAGWPRFTEPLEGEALWRAVELLQAHDSAPGIIKGKRPQ